MVRLLTAVLLFASFHTVAEVTLTPLNNNTPADADDVMGNLNALNEALPPSNCTTDQIIKWDGSAWVCATGDLAGLVCEEEDTITFRNGTWQCSSATPPEESCTNYYRDFDSDGYGDPTNSQCLSSPTGYYTATNASDCYDNNADAKPTQTGFFSTHRGDGSYDYNCNGTQQERYTETGFCQYIANSSVGFCNSSPGWTGVGAPSCGFSGDHIIDCDLGLFECNEVTISRTQTCQ